MGEFGVHHHPLTLSRRLAVKNRARSLRTVPSLRLTASAFAGFLEWVDDRKINRQILFSDFLTMPNWVFNDVVIEAPLEDVKLYLTPSESTEEALHFNLHRLWPEVF